MRSGKKSAQVVMNKLSLTYRIVEARPVYDNELFDLINLRPWVEEDRIKFDEEAVYNLIERRPGSIKVQYKFRAGRHYPLYRIVALGGSLNLIKLLVKTFPNAVFETEIYSGGGVGVGMESCSSGFGKWGGITIGPTSKMTMFSSSGGGIKRTASADNFFNNLNLAGKFGSGGGGWNGLGSFGFPDNDSRSSNSLPDEQSLYISGSTLLHAACAFKAPFEIVQYLYSLNPNACYQKTKYGYTPLHNACEYGASENVIAFLVDVCPEAVHIKNRLGMTPLMIIHNKNSESRLTLNLVTVLSNDSISTGRRVLLSNVDHSLHAIAGSLHHRESFSTNFHDSFTNFHDSFANDDTSSHHSL